jgi:hypothetical protein
MKLLGLSEGFEIRVSFQLLPRQPIVGSAKVEPDVHKPDQLVHHIVLLLIISSDGFCCYLLSMDGYNLFARRSVVHIPVYTASRLNKFVLTSSPVQRPTG